MPLARFSKVVSEENRLREWLGRGYLTFLVTS